MEINEQREKFVEQLRKLESKRFYEESKIKEPTLWEIADGYRSFIEDLGPGFMEILESLNVCLQIAKQRGLIGKDSNLNARIKDFSSSLINSDKKILDDIFGVEIVSENDFENELMILFCNIVFNISKDKKYNKTNGYRAYHCMGDFKPKDGDLRETIISTIQQAKTVEYKRSKSEPNYKDKKRMISLFPNLQNIINNSKVIDMIVSVFSEMLEYINITDRSSVIPEIEMHFITKKDKEVSLTGSAAHSKYKGANQKQIIQKFKQGKLIRGINSPWKFYGTKKGMKLQDFYKTLEENWEFLGPHIRKRRELGKEEKDNKLTEKFDILTATIYSFLRKYVRYNYKIGDDKKEEIWGILKAAILTDRIEGQESLEDEFINILPDFMGWR